MNSYNMQYKKKCKTTWKLMRQLQISFNEFFALFRRKKRKCIPEYTAKFNFACTALRARLIFSLELNEQNESAV